MASSTSGADAPAPTDSYTDAEMLNALGYEQKFERKMGLWANFALGFLYLSPLVGVVALFALGITTAGPPAIWWIVVVMIGQALVALVFGEIVSQYPLAGGVYQWARRLWSGQYAWFAAWMYIATLIIGITTTALFSATFVASLFGLEVTRTVTLVAALAVLLLGLALNMTGTHALSRISSMALAAELTGVVAVGLYLLLFRRVQPFGVVFDSHGAGGTGSYAAAFITASLVGLYLFYGFEACGEVAEEVPNPSRRIPRAMVMTVLIGGVSALLSFYGYILAADNLDDIVAGKVADPITNILESSLGTVGTKIFLVIALTSFLAGVMGQQAAASRLLFSFGRDRMLPGWKRISNIHPRRHVPMEALVFVNIPPVAIFVVVFFSPDSLPRIAGFQVLAGYAAFQMVVLAALRQRLRGWKPAGQWSLGRWGMLVNVTALLYGVSGMILLAKPGKSDLPFLDRWISLIGFLIVVGVGLAYLIVARPDRKSDAPQGDAIEFAAKIRDMRPGASATRTGAVPAP